MVRFSVVRFGNGPFWLWDETSCSHLDNINWDIDPNSDVNSQYENFNNNFLEIADKYAPFKERKIKPKAILACRSVSLVFISFSIQ